MKILSPIIHSIAAAALVLSFGSAARAAAAETTNTVSIPPQSELLSRLVPGHPRLLVSPLRLGMVKRQLAENDPLLVEWLRELHSDAQDIIGAAPSKYEIPDGLRLLSTSRRVLQRIETLGLLYLLETNRAYSDRAWKELEAAANFPDWNPRHFLDTAEMTRAFAEGYDWFYHAWTSEQRRGLEQAIVKFGLEPSRELYRRKQGWTRARHNWNQVCNGGMGMGALAIADVQPELAAEILRGALESLPLAMTEFAPDGAWNEGPGYWSYATAYNVAFLDALQTALGTSFGLADIPGFSDTGLFSLYISSPVGRTFNYADGGDSSIRAPQMFWLAQQFRQPVLAWHQRQPHSPSALDVLWYCTEWRTPKVARLPLAKYFRGAEVVTMRSEWQNKKAWFVGFKAGDNKANHSHLDLGSFVMDFDGVRWATDLGAENYNLPGYFGSQRWTYYRLRAEGNNTLTINPGKEPDQDPKAATKIVKFKESDERAFAIADLTAAYQKHGVEKVMRGISLLNGKQVVIQDEIRSGPPADVWWFMHTAADIQVGSSNRREAVLKERERTLYARIISPESAAFEVLPAAPLPSSPQPAKQNLNTGFRKLAIHLNQATNVTVTVVFSPEPGAKAEVKTLENW